MYVYIYIYIHIGYNTHIMLDGLITCCITIYYKLVYDNTISYCIRPLPDVVGTSDIVFADVPQIPLILLIIMLIIIIIIIILMIIHIKYHY